MPLVSHNAPIYSIKGPLKSPDGTAVLQLYPNRRAGLIAKRITPNPYAPTPTQINLMNIHVLNGPLHTVSALTPGQFLKATGPGNFAFAPHGLTAPDVGALPVAAQAADSDKLDGQHASEFLPLHGTADAALDSDKLDGQHASAFLGVAAQAADSDKLDGQHAAAFAAATHYHSALAASDLTPNPALSIDTNAVASIISPDTTKSLSLAHDNSNAYIKQSLGNLILQNTAAETVQQVTIRGTGSTNAAYAQLRIDDKSVSQNYTILAMYAGQAALYVGGAGITAFQMLQHGWVNLACFDAATSGLTPALQISGYRAADAKRTLSIAVGSQAADTASISGLTNYKFTGSINATANLQTAGTTRIDNAGNASLGTIGAGETTLSGELKMGANPITTTGQISAERLEISSPGGIGHAYAAHFTNAGNSTDSRGINIRCGENTPTTTNYPIRFSSGDGTEVGLLTWDTNSLDLTWTSGRALKSNITDTQADSREKIAQTRVADYQRLADPLARTWTGFIAEELAVHFPEAVETVTDPETGTSQAYIKPMRLIPHLFHAIQQQDALIHGLILETIQLRKRMDRLENPPLP